MMSDSVEAQWLHKRETQTPHTRFMTLPLWPTELPRHPSTVVNRPSSTKRFEAELIRPHDYSAVSIRNVARVLEFRMRY